jgi:hypothetical protein
MTGSKGDHDVIKATADESARIRFRQKLVSGIAAGAYSFCSRVPRRWRQQRECQDSPHPNADRHPIFYSIANSDLLADPDSLIDFDTCSGFGLSTAIRLWEPGGAY